MKLYFAVTGPREPVYLPENGIKTMLCSYHYYKNDIKTMAQLIKTNDIFIDSGAFSAENAGKTIDIDDYCKYLLSVQAVNYAGLDVIGDAENTLKNQHYMEKEYELKPIPTFHMGEGIEHALILASEYEYIAIGGMVFSEGIESWLDKLFNEMLKRNPQLKCHGFGMTNSWLMEKYPWYSCDSSSFKSGKRFGRLILYNSKKNTLLTEDFNSWVDKYAALTYDDLILTDSQYRYELTDVLSAKSYLRFVEYVNKKNMDNKFHYLTAQKTIFDI